MPVGNVSKCTNFLGFPHSTVKKSEKFARMALKGSNDNNVQKILEQMTGLLDKKLVDYRRQSVVLGVNIFSTETTNLQMAARENFSELQQLLIHPLPTGFDPTLFAHYLLEDMRLNASADTSCKYKFNINKAVLFRKEIYEKYKFNLAEPRLSNAGNILKSLDVSARKIEKITEQIEIVARYAERKKVNYHIPLSIEQKFLNALKPHSYC